MLKHYRNRSIWLSVLFSLGLVASLAMPLSSTAQSRNPAINACMPRPGIVRTEMVGSTRLNGVDYYLLITYETQRQDEIGADLIISVKDGKCELAFWNPMGDWVAYADSVPQAVARHLALLDYQRTREQLGTDEFNRQVRQSLAQGDAPDLFDEDLWALEQLGFDVPGR